MTGLTLVLSLLVVVSISAVSAQNCPDYMADKGCSGGPCVKGGVKGKFRIPSDCPLLIGYGTGKYVLKGDLPEDTSLPSDSDSTNGQLFPRTKIRASPKRTAAKCCQKCKSKSNCKFWQHLSLGAFGGICFTYAGPVGPVCTNSVLVKTRVGAKCAETVNDDPHFVGAQGTHYDFNGQPDKSFCLLTDRNLHINMKMTGYLDERTESASLIKDGKALRTWIRELGLLWFVDGEEHALRLVARAGKETARGEGFLALAQADSVALPRMQVGDELALEGGLTLKFEAIEKKGPYDVDFYTVRIGDLLDMEVRLRVANPLLQTPDEAETHISLGINSIKTTPAVHGVLGQTYREGREVRAEEYSKITAALGQNIAADGETGKGFLDGAPSDYMTTDVMEADCHFSQYQGHVTRPSVTSE